MNKILEKARREVQRYNQAVQDTIVDLEEMRNAAATKPELRSLVTRTEAKLERQQERLALGKKELAALEQLANDSGKTTRRAAK
mgnify:CR=1 FL=1